MTRRKREGGCLQYTGGWTGDSNAYFHFSKFLGRTRGKQGEDGVRVEDGERSNLRVVRVRIEVPSD